MKKLTFLLSVLALLLAPVPNVRHHYDQKCSTYLGYGNAVFTQRGVSCRNIYIGLTVPLSTLQERYDKFGCKKPGCFAPMPYRTKDA